MSCKYWLTSATDLPVGSVLDERYELLKPLGKGGMGIVFKAHDSVLEEVVALKLLRSDIAETPDIARRFRQEIRLARKVRHRNVCAIHEYGEDGGIRFISMEFVEGVDLREVLRGKGIPNAIEALDISIQIAEGLEAIHEAGIIHRDLKTANAMMDAKGIVHLMDFGIAKQAGGEPTLGATALGTIMGTPEYMSPEQGRGEKIDFRTDIYSLGIMIFEIFTGKLPFKAETPIATIFKQIQDPPPLTGGMASRIPGPAIPVLAKALAKAPQDRYQSVQEMLHTLREVRAACAPPGQKVARTAPRPPVVPGAVAPQIDPEPRSQAARTSVSTVVPPHARRPVPSEPAAPQDPAVAVRAVAQRVQELLQQDQLESAAAALAQAEAACGSVPPLTELRRRLTEEDRRRRFDLLLDRAESLLAGASLDEARQALDQALAAEPQASPRWREIEARLAGALEERDERIRRERALEEALAEVRAALDRGALDAAAHGLSEIEASYGSLDPVRALRARLASEEDRARRAAVSSWIERAESLLSGGDLGGAREAALEAQKIDAQDRRARQLLSRVDAEETRRTDEARRAEALETATARARSLAGDGALEEAVSLLVRAERENGASEASRSLRKQIEALQRERAAEQKRQQREAKRQARAAAAASVSSEQGAPGPRSRLWLVGGLAGGAVVVGLVLIGVVWYRLQPDTTRVSTEPVTTVTVPIAEETPAAVETTPVPIAAGQQLLIVDALPWAEVVSIVGRDGKPLPLGSARYTPAVVRLPEGSYTVSLRHPQYGQSEETVVVRSEVENRHVVDLGRIDARQYLREAGF